MSAASARVVAFAAALVAAAAPAGAAEVRGIVRGFPDGEPLAGVQVLVMDPQGAAAEGWSGADGSYVVDGVEAGRVRVRARPPQEINRIGAYWDDRPAFSFCGADVLVLAEGEVALGVDFELPEGGVIEGSVSWADGPSMLGATATASGLDYYSQNLQRWGTVDSEGQFRITGLDSASEGGEPVPGRYQVSVRVPGDPPLFAPGRWFGADDEDLGVVEALRGETRTVHIHRPPLSRVEAQALDWAGVAASSAAGRLQIVGGGSRETTAGDDGGLLFTEVPGAGATLDVRAPGLARTFWPGVHWSGEAETLELQAGSSLDLGELVLGPGGRLFGAVSGLDAHGAILTLSQQDTLETLGRSTLSLADPDFEFDSLPPGGLLLELGPASPESLALRWTDEVYVGPGESRQIAIEQARGGALAGTVRARGGGFVRGVVLRAEEPGGLPPTWRAVARSDGEGRFTVRGVPEGAALALRLDWQPFCERDPGYVPIRVPGEGPLDVQPEPGQTRVIPPILLPPDHDRDGMDDVWELAWGLRPGYPDGTSDADADGVANRDEYLARGDPRDPAARSQAPPATARGACSAAPAGRGAAPALACLLAVALLARHRRSASIRRPPAAPLRPAPESTSP